MKHLERRVLNVEEAYRRIGLASIPPLYVQYVRDEDLRPYGATEFEQSRYRAALDRVNVHAQELVNLHGMGVLRSHKVRNDALNALTNDDLEFVQYMIETYRPGVADDEVA